MYFFEISDFFPPENRRIQYFTNDTVGAQPGDGQLRSEEKGSGTTKTMSSSVFTVVDPV